MAEFDYNGCQIHYEVQGTGPALLFMHGLAADCRQAQQSLEDLIGYQVITVDMPGHGTSELSANQSLKSQVGFVVYADIAAALLRHLQIDKAIIGGISMGAGIALHMGLSKPKLVAALLLVRPAWLDRPGRPHLGIIEDIGNWIAQAGIEGAFANLADHPLYQTVCKENPACAASIKGAIRRPQANAAAGVLPALVADRPMAQISALHKCELPALVVGNNADPLHPVVIAREIAGAMPGAQYFHAPPKYLEPDAHKISIARKVDEFLAALFHS